MKYVLINKMTTKPGKRQDVINILLEAGKLFDTNSSCLMYLVSAARDDPNVIWVQDIWDNKEDHETAMRADEMSVYIKKAMPMLEGVPVQFQVEPAGGKSSIL